MCWALHPPGHSRPLRKGQLCRAGLLPCAAVPGQPAGLRFNEVFVSHGFLHPREGRNRWSGFKAGHRTSMRAPLWILDLGRKQKLGVGGFSEP